MMKAFTKWLYATLLAIAALPSFAATTYYVCDCQTGTPGGSAAVGCVNGSSGANGTAAATPKQLPSQVTLGVSDGLLF
jgi:hypothetical protein